MTPGRIDPAEAAARVACIDYLCAIDAGDDLGAVRARGSVPPPAFDAALVSISLALAHIVVSKFGFKGLPDLLQKTVELARKQGRIS